MGVNGSELAFVSHVVKADIASMQGASKDVDALEVVTAQSKAKKTDR